MQLEFKDFILNENKAYLGEKISDVLTAIDSLQDDGAHMGARQLVRFSERIVAKIRRILHSNWPQNEQKYLKTLQKVGVAIMKGIDEKQDLKDIIPAVQQELQQLLGKLGVPVNQLGDAPDQELPDNTPEGDVEGSDKEGEQQGQQGQDMQQGQPQAPQDPNMGQQMPPGPAMGGGQMPPPPPPPMA